MWLIVDRENQPDPLHDEIGAAYSGAGAAFIFFDRGQATTEESFLGSPQPSDSPIEHVYDVKDYSAATLDQVMNLPRQVVDRRQPKRIGINTSQAFPQADGVTASLKDALTRALGPEHASRLVSAEVAVHAFRATRTPLETKWYAALQEWTARW